MADECLPILNRIAELKSQRQSLQKELGTAPPALKPALVELIKKLNTDISQQESELRKCRSDNPQPSFPDFSIHFRFCIPDQDTRDQLIEQLNEAFEDENGIAHSQCINGDEKIGIWIPERGSPEARELGLESINLLDNSGENISMLLRRSLVQRQVRAEWNAQPKVLNSNGNPDPQGNTILTNLTFQFEQPNRVVTQIEGFRRRLFPLPDTDFTIAITDLLSVVTQGELEEIGKLQCHTSSNIDADFDVFDLIASSLLGGPLVGAIRGLFQVAVDIFDSSLGPDQDEGGVGCGLLKLYPDSIEVGDEQSLDVTYRRIQVFPSSIKASGTASLISRTSNKIKVSSDFSGRGALVVEGQ